jgi:hypothetical protein
MGAGGAFAKKRPRLGVPEAEIKARAGAIKYRKKIASV